MGNCIKKESENEWGGEYWGSPVSSPENTLLEKKSFTGDKDCDDMLHTKKPTTEVKIKVTKKQLEELLGMTEMKGLSLQQVLSKLINDRSQEIESNQRSWTPNLQSIPE